MSSKSFLSRIEALERATGLRDELTVVIWKCRPAESPISGYEWGMGPTGGERRSITRKLGESDRELLDRAEATAPRNGAVMVLTEI